MLRRRKNKRKPFSGGGIRLSRRGREGKEGHGICCCGGPSSSSIRKRSENEFFFFFFLNHGSLLPKFDFFFSRSDVSLPGPTHRTTKCLQFVIFSTPSPFFFWKICSRQDSSCHHALQSSHVALLSCNFEITIDNAIGKVSRYTQ